MRYDDRVVKTWKGLKLFYAVGNIPPAPGVTEQTNDFGMIFIADDNDRMVFAGMFADDGLDLDDPRTGRVDDLESGVLESLFRSGRHPMGTNQYCSVAALGNFFQDRNVLGL